MSDSAVVSVKGARRWQHGHPWIFRSDVIKRPDAPASSVLVCDQRGRTLGWALWSPKSEISLRLLDRDPRAIINADWWRTRIQHAIARRGPLRDNANAFRLIHAEGDA